MAPVLFYSQRRRTPSLKRGESDSLLYRDSLSRKRRECFASIQRGGTLLLGAEEGVAPVLFYSQRRRTPSLKGRERERERERESDSLLYREEADRFSRRRREWLPFSSMPRGGILLFMTRRACLDSV